MSDQLMGTAATGETPATSGSTTSLADFGKEMWSYLTGRGAAINYEFVDMYVEVPRDTGASSPRATWRLHGTLRITTSDDEAAGAPG